MAGATPGACRIRILGAALAIVLGVQAPLAAGSGRAGHAAAPAATSGSASPAPGGQVALSNGRSLTALWQASGPAPADDPGLGGPGLDSLHAAPDWRPSLVAGEAASLVDRATGARLDRGASFQVSASLAATGILRVRYLRYAGRPLPLNLVTESVLVPGESFLVRRYRLGSWSGRALRIALLEQVRLSPGAAPEAVGGVYDAARGSLFVPVAGGVLFLVALSGASGHEVDLGAAGGAAWRRFNAGRALSDSVVGRGAGVDLALEIGVRLRPHTGATVYVALGTAPTLAAARAHVARLEAAGGAFWLGRTAIAYARWLSAGVRPPLSGRLRVAYDRALVRLENDESPATGLFAAGPRAQVAASALAAMALAEAGHSAQMDRLWRTLGAREGVRGRWPSVLDPWTGQPIAVAGPTYADLGLALAAIWSDGRAAPHPAVVWQPLWPLVARTAGFLAANVGPDGLGLPDRGPWHGAFAYWTYSQGMYVVGLEAAGQVARALGHRVALARFADAAATLETSLQTPQSASLPGMWNDATQAYDQGQAASGGPEGAIDASLTALWALGALPIGTARAQTALFAIDTALGRDGGLVPYAGAPRALGPALEAQLFRAVDEVDVGQRQAAARDLAAYRGGGGAEGAASYVLAALAYAGRVNPTVPAPLPEAGARIALARRAGAGWDWQAVAHLDLQAVASPAGTPPVARLALANNTVAIAWHLIMAPSPAAVQGAGREPIVVLYVGARGGGPEATAAGLFGGRLAAPMDAALAVAPGGGAATVYRSEGAGGWHRVGPAPAGAGRRRAGGQAAGGVVRLNALLGGRGVPAPDSHLALEVGWGWGRARREVDLAAVRYRWTGLGETAIDGVPPGAAIARLATDRARYDPGEVVRVTADLVDQSLWPDVGTLRLVITHLGRPVSGGLSVPVALAPGQARVYALTWTPPRRDDQGYLVEAVAARRSGVPIGTAVTAVDVSSSWTTFPRYGYLTQFGPGAAQGAAWTLSLLDLYHLNALQFYDWQWQHGHPLAGSVAHPAPAWPDVAGATNLRRSVLALIEQAHARGMLAFEYDLLYGAWAQTVGRAGGPQRAWALYAAPGCREPLVYPLPAGWETAAIDLFDPASPAWQAYIDAQERAVFRAYPFDGWQVDQLGAQGAAYACDGRPVDLAAAFRVFLTQARRALGRRLVFNAVGGYGQAQVANKPSPLDVAYTEAWPSAGQATYGDLRSIVQGDRALGDGLLASVIAAYPDSALAEMYSNAAPGNFGTAGVRLLDAAIFASGGDHIELGDQNQMLSGPYFPSTALVLDGPLARAIGNEYNFITAYEDALRGPGLTDLSAAVSIQGVATSSDGEPGAVWAFARGRHGLDVLELINLRGRASSAWSDPNGTDPPPPLLRGATVRYPVGPGGVRAVYVASPDLSGGVARPLAFRLVAGRRGPEVVFRLPTLDYWDMVLIDRG